MINHLRTLLLNERPNVDAEHEQYISPGFMPLRLTGEIAAVRNEILKSRWPRAYKNFVATQMTRLAYGSPMASSIDLLDRRGTILFGENLVPEIRDRLSLTTYGSTSSLKVVGAFSPSVDDGLFGGQWEIKYAGADSVLIRDLSEAASSEIEITFTEDTTGLYPIDGRSPLYFQFVGASQVPSDLHCVVEAKYAMQIDLTLMLRRLQANPRTRSIFDSTTNRIVFQQLRDQFANAGRVDHQLAAVLIAFGFRASSQI